MRFPPENFSPLHLESAEFSSDPATGLICNPMYLNTLLAQILISGPAWGFGTVFAKFYQKAFK